MKSSLLRSFVIFSAGAATAALAAGAYPRSVRPQEILERFIAVNAELAALGSYVAMAEDGRVGIYTNTDGLCVSPKPPVPNDPPVPPGGVNLIPFQRGLKAAEVVLTGILMHVKEPVYEYAACWPTDERWAN